MMYEHSDDREFLLWQYAETIDENLRSIFDALRISKLFEICKIILMIKIIIPLKSILFFHFSFSRINLKSGKVKGIIKETDRYRYKFTCILVIVKWR